MTSTAMTSGQAAFAAVTARAIRSGDFDVVTIDGEEVFAGTAHDALGIAKDTIANPRYGTVAIITAAGRTLDAATIAKARF